MMTQMIRVSDAKAHGHRHRDGAVTVSLLRLTFWINFGIGWQWLLRRRSCSSHSDSLRRPPRLC